MPSFRRSKPWPAKVTAMMRSAARRPICGCGASEFEAIAATKIAAAIREMRDAGL
jgi:hypothetical protein